MYKVQRLETYKPIENIFSLYKFEQDVSILESSLQNKLGKYSIIGRSPYHKIVKTKDGVYINGEKRAVDFKGYVKEYFSMHYLHNRTNLPITSGAVGYFSYDYERNKNGKIPESILIFYDEFIIEDHQDKAIYLVANGKNKVPDLAIKNLENDIENVCIDDGELCVKKSPNIDYNFKKEAYLNSIRKMINYIIEGDIYIANMTQQLFITSEVKPYELYTTLRKNNPSPFGAYLNYEGFQVVCASPERFIQVRNNKIVTRPIKGTRKRGVTVEEDLQMIEELSNSEKDKSELLMIVDLERNDLSKICKPGSVVVEDLYGIESYATVHHLVAEVSGVLQDNIDMIDMIQATFPGGSITGAPKIRAMEIIEELENGNRGLYTGSIGYCSLNGDCDMNIVIRTAVYQDSIYSLGVGGGITSESKTLSEYEETLQKAKAFVDALS